MDKRLRGVDLGASASSDKPEKPLRFNTRLELPFVRMRLESIQPPKPFQAADQFLKEYEVITEGQRSKRWVEDQPRV
jgi:hypothetical protein